ncbi:16S rRNA processing protein RimM [hydrothermal vent metagenome]|uniref:16S rRNA processing protein RimM n=1 Tax=hydrothermal vent metagenome TaxID=652676 RepID=A0A3B1BV98_9ZZZZ
MSKTGLPGSENKIAVGRFLKPHGVHGEIKFLAFFEDAVLDLLGEPLTIQPEHGEPFTMAIDSLRGGNSSIAKLNGIETPEDVKKITPALVLAPKHLMPKLPDGEYYYEDIIGLPVFDYDSGEKIGVLQDFFSAGEKDVWEIKKEDGGELLVPYIAEIVKEVDIEGKRIVISPMEEVE